MSQDKENKFGDWQETLQGAGEKLKDQFTRAAEDVDVDALRKSAEEMADEAAAFVRKYPLQTAVGLFAAGCVAGLLFGRRRE